MLQGIPASGKSTYAEELAFAHPTQYVIVGLDRIRKALGKYWVPEREPLVRNIEECMITEAIAAGYNVILDSTNLNPVTIMLMENLAHELDVELEKKRFKISLEEALERDAAREEPIGEDVIKRFYYKYCKKKEDEQEN